jgi:hypothetical protein
MGHIQGIHSILEPFRVRKNCRGGGSIVEGVEELSRGRIVEGVEEEECRQNTSSRATIQPIRFV